MKFTPILAGLFALSVALPAAAETLRLAVTTSFANSGLAEVLLPALEADTGVHVDMVVVGTGQALNLGEAGDVDAVLVHARAAEDKFVADGHAPYRRQLMYNDFVLIGPSADPEGVAASASAIDAFKALSSGTAPFVSRGDDSGTHLAELAQWKAAGVTPQGDWYRPVGQGMGAALNTAAGMDAYILSDRATWLAFENKADLKLLYAGDPALFNQYAWLPVSGTKGDFVHPDIAQKVEDWLTGPRGKDLIDGFRVAGEQVFTFNAEPK
jgi:tungstate transport system substrate-binding protein